MSNPSHSFVSLEAEEDGREELEEETKSEGGIQLLSICSMT